MIDSEQLIYRALKTRQREIRDQFPEALSLRVHRAQSWLNRAEQETKDQGAKFIFPWIAFNRFRFRSTYEDGKEVLHVVPYDLEKERLLLPRASSLRELVMSATA